MTRFATAKTPICWHKGYRLVSQMVIDETVREIRFWVLDSDDNEIPHSFQSSKGVPPIWAFKAWVDMGIPQSFTTEDLWEWHEAHGDEDDIPYKRF